jgi:hypothetical protein
MRVGVFCHLVKSTIVEQTDNNTVHTCFMKRATVQQGVPVDDESLNP